MSKIAFIVEGEKTEEMIIDSLCQVFLPSKREIEMIVLPATTNIYTIWKKMKADDWETTLVDVVKEAIQKSNLSGSKKARAAQLSDDDFSEVYLFFDYDGHANDIPDANPYPVICEMLHNFNNETEAGKLFISYPMAEAIKDFKDITTNWETLYTNIDLGREYKRIVSDRAYCNNYKKYDEEIWSYILNGFVKSLSKLHEKQFSFDDYRNTDAECIYELQYHRFILTENKVMVLSAFPEFVLDYFGEEFWKRYIKN